VIEFTDKARQQVLEFIREEEEAGLAVRLAVLDSSPFSPRYDLALIESWERKPDDTAYDVGGFEVVVDPGSASFLDGASVDWVESLQGSGFKVENPNERPAGTEPAAGELADRVKQVIDQQVNPTIASHGGAVSLVDVREGVVYLSMSGGCQGCGMAAVTLKQGVERLIIEAIPEVAGVEDVTDHASGTDPYYRG
jgi:Fe/S biogenesis protein NfuA